jgi:hypothetical protein
MVARKLFEIRWNEQHHKHEVLDYGQKYPPALTGEPLKRRECRLLSVGDILAIGSFTVKYVELATDVECAWI